VILVSAEFCEPSSCGIITILIVTYRQQESEAAAVAKKGTVTCLNVTS